MSNISYQPVMADFDNLGNLNKMWGPNGKVAFDPANASFTGPTLFANGSTAAPGIAFAANTNTGFRNSAGILVGVSLGTDVFAFEQQYGLRMAGKPVIFESSILSGTFLTGLYPDAANTLAQRNGTAAQTFNLYSTYTDASNYERLVFSTGVGSVAIAPQSSGTGSASITLSLYGKGSAGYVIVNPGSTGFVFDPGSGIRGYGDATADVGSSANRIRSLYAAQINAATKAGAFVAGDIAAGTFMVGRDTVGATTKLYYNNGGVLMSVALA